MKKSFFSYLYKKMDKKTSQFQQLSDEELIKNYREKQESEILGVLYLRYGHLVFGTCLKYLKNREDAEDIVMDIFTSLGNKLEKYEIKYFKSWLYILTKNECMAKLRKQNKISANNAMETIAYSDEISEKEKQELTLTALEEAIQLLDKPQNEVIQLFYIQQLSYKEISTQLNLPLKKIKSAIQNGKRNLKIKLMKNAIFKSA